MSIRSISGAVLLLVLTSGAELWGADRNWWPGVVRRDVHQPGESWSALGPFLFSQPVPPERRVYGFRPLLVLRRDATGAPEGGTFLYPLVRWENHPDGYSWSVYNLMLGRGVETASGAGDMRALDIWPVYFSRQTDEPATSYRAVFPLYGDVRNRFGQDRWRWVLFPLYGRFERNGVTTTTAPWPFIKVLQGDGNRGFELWPLGGHRAKAGVYRQDYALWPLLYRNETQLAGNERTLAAGFLPFYAIDRHPGYISETYGWPFWGYVHRTAPYQYHARHYFWPFWVQGRGDHRYINRWAPFYTHSIIKDSDKRWVAWPVWRHHRWQDSGVAHDRRQVLYFLYHSTTQHSLSNPAAAPAVRRHVWPLYSAWDNGAGRRQVQVLSPLEVFFPHNEHMRRTWSPLFAVYRYNRSAPGETRHSVLWDAVTYRRSRTASEREFHLGPLFSIERTAERKRVTLLNGLLGLHRSGNHGWRFFFLQGSSATSSDATSP